MRKEDSSSFCGKDCSQCPLFTSHPDFSADKSALKELIEEQLGILILPEEFSCDGCKSRNRFIHVTECPIPFCCTDQTLDFCAQCPQFCCEMHMEITRNTDFQKI